MNKITIDKALIFSVSVLFVYSIITEIQIFMDKVPNDTLTISIFAVFGLAEGGFCTYLHTKKKEREKQFLDDDFEVLGEDK